jgi:hypothetical protein
MNQRNVLRYLLLLPLIIIFSGCSVFSTQKAAEEIAARFQITPSWDAIRSHLFYEFSSGMTREEAHKVLDKVGPWKIDPSVDSSLWMDPYRNQLIYSEGIFFTEDSVGWEMGYWMFRYDKNDVLVDWHLVDR